MPPFFPLVKWGAVTWLPVARSDSEAYRIVDKNAFRRGLNSKDPIMSFLSHLFHPHQQVDTASSRFSKWVGQSGTKYPYEIHPLDAQFQAVPANYIYARQSEDGTWVPIYIAQTRALSQRLEGHINVEDARAHGASHIHVHLSSAGQAARCSEEHDLVNQWHPMCNDVLES
jgi:hypothetical protein